MKNILFIDDEPKVLQGLQRMLRSMRHEWHMEFAGGGQEALEMLAREPFDMVVTDMRMPGVDGAQLLKEVMEKYPGVVRVILSGQTDQEVFLSSTRIVHQFLSKPCDAETLKTTLARVFAAQELLKDEMLRNMVLQIESLPSLPGLYAEIINELQSPNADIKKTGHIISRDIGMTAKVLQIVNSAFYGLQRRISNPTEAAIILGTNVIRALVLSHHLFSHFNDVKLLGLSPDELWKHSILTGSFAGQIVKSENLPPERVDDALVAGMLHDIGKLILAKYMSDRYLKALVMAHEKHIPHWEAEGEAFGGTHAEVGAFLLGLWGISDAVTKAVAFHHSPKDAPDNKMFTLVTAVHVADVLANEACPSATEFMEGLKIDAEYIVQSGMAERLLVWRKSCLETEQKGGNR